jgi:hypothetical protein
MIRTINKEIIRLILQYIIEIKDLKLADNDLDKELYILIKHKPLIAAGIIDSILEKENTDNIKDNNFDNGDIVYIKKTIMVRDNVIKSNKYTLLDITISINILKKAGLTYIIKQLEKIDGKPSLYSDKIINKDNTWEPLKNIVIKYYGSKNK